MKRLSIGSILAKRKFAHSKYMDEQDKGEREKQTKAGDEALASSFQVDTKLCDRDDANLVTSIADVPGNDLKQNGWDTAHYPVIDFDFPIAVTPSRTPGHYHLYIEKAVPYEQYMKLLIALYEAGLQGKGNLAQMDRGGATYARIAPYNRILVESQQEYKLEVMRTLTEWKEWKNL